MVPFTLYAVPVPSGLVFHPVKTMPSRWNVFGVTVSLVSP